MYLKTNTKIGGKSPPCVGNHDEFERRIGLFPVSFDDKGRMRTHTVLGDYPMSLPQKRFNPQDISAFGWMPNLS